MHLNIKERIAIYKFDREKGHCQIGSFIFTDLFFTINQIVFYFTSIVFQTDHFLLKIFCFFLILTSLGTTVVVQ